MEDLFRMKMATKQQFARWLAKQPDNTLYATCDYALCPLATCLSRLNGEAVSVIPRRVGQGQAFYDRERYSTDPETAQLPRWANTFALAIDEKGGEGGSIAARECRVLLDDITEA